MLVLARRLNESIMIGDEVEIVVVALQGDQVKIGIRAPRSVPVYRKEIYEEIQRENVAAAQAAASGADAASALLKGVKPPENPGKPKP